MTTQEAFNELVRAIKADDGYAWSWHCNIAVCAQDEGMDHAASNRAAARFMKLCFDASGYEPRKAGPVRGAS